MPLSAGSTCGKADSLIAGALPHIITVKLDRCLAEQSRIAFVFWAETLGVRFSEVQDLSDCMIRVRMAAHTTVPLAMQPHIDDRTMGVAYPQGTERFDGVAYIFIPRAWVIAHEIGHLLGFDHTTRGLMEIQGGNDWLISKDQISLAQANRVRFFMSERALLQSKGTPKGP